MIFQKTAAMNARMLLMLSMEHEAKCVLKPKCMGVSMSSIYGRSTI